MLTTAQEAPLTSPPPAKPPARMMQTRSMIIALDQLHPSPTNPRRTFPAPALAELADTIRRHGVLQPILVRPWPDGYQSISATARYEIVAGERRYRASLLAELPGIPATVRTLTDTDVLEIQTIENLQREDVHPLEEAEGYQMLMQRTHYSAEDIATKLGKSKAYIYARLKLCAITGKAREAFLAGEISASIALLIARIPVPALQQRATQEITNDYSGGMSARQAAEHLQRNYMLRLADAPFPRGDAKLLEGTGTCNKCPSRTGNQPELFADVKSADVCTDPDCFSRKREAYKARQAAEAKAAGKKVITGKEAERIAPYGISEYGQQLNAGWECLDRKVWEAPAKKNNQPPTWRELLGADFVAETLIEDTRNGTLREIAQGNALRAAAKNLGIKLRESTSRPTGGEAQRAKEKKAKAETAYRGLLLDRILFAHAGEALREADLIDVALALWNRLGSEGQRQLCKAYTGKNSHEDIQHLQETIPSLAPPALNKLLLASALIGSVHVSHWQTIEPPERMLAAAERWGIDVKAVKKQAAEALAPKAKAAKAVKAKPTAREIKYRDPDSGKTWSGRGQKPAWVKARLQEGKSLGELEVGA